MNIDAHHHLPADWEPYLDKLRPVCARLGIDRVCVTALTGPGYATNEQLVEALRQHSDLLIGYGFYRIGADEPSLVDDLRAAGCRGMKFIWPLVNYDDDLALPAYERCEALGMPALFHLGIVWPHAHDQALDVSSARMQAIQLDRLARHCPDLAILGAHLGNPDYHVAGELARLHKNVYFDLTGSTLKKKPPEFIAEVFWWGRNARYGNVGYGIPPYQKILFGTDVAAEEMEDIYEDYQRVMDALELSAEDRRMIMGGTAERLFGL
jgi:predicted TIM-barrel fold metal-dependent hydrolase